MSVLLFCVFKSLPSVSPKTVVPTFFDAFLPLLISDLIIPPLFGFVGYSVNHNCNNGLY